MEKSRANWQLRGALKRRTRKWRRRQVFGLYVLMLIALLTTTGGDHHSFRYFVMTVSPIIIALTVGRRWSQMQQRVVTNLDDRAQIAHGVNFDQLCGAEQKELLRKYRMGRYILDVDWVSDERQQAFRLQAQNAAYRLLRTALPWFVVGYWVLYLFVPAGDAKDALMDSPVMISWLAVFVVTLPRVIEMWMEPDDIGEPRAV